MTQIPLPCPELQTHSIAHYDERMGDITIHSDLVALREILYSEAKSSDYTQSHYTTILKRWTYLLQYWTDSAMATTAANTSPWHSAANYLVASQHVSFAAFQRL